MVIGYRRTVSAIGLKVDQAGLMKGNSTCNEPLVTDTIVISPS